MIEYRNMRVEILDVAGIVPALIGMRNPMNSWHLGDSIDKSDSENYRVSIGENDMRLAQQLIKAGDEHCKFLRQIQVWLDIKVPRYIWSELDTYKFNTKNSCSTMHKLLNDKHKIDYSDFYIEDDSIKPLMNNIIDSLNAIREEYLRTKDIKYLRMAKQILPESFLQLRTMNTNYAELRNIVKQRKNHRLDKEWELFIKTIKELPYADEFIFLDF